MILTDLLQLLIKLWSCWLYVNYLLLIIHPLSIADHMSNICCWYVYYLLLIISSLSIADYMSTMYCWLYVHYLNLAPSLFFWLSACTKDRKRRIAFNCWQTTITFKNRELLKSDLRYVKLVNSLKIGKTTATFAKNARHCGTYNDPLSLGQALINGGVVKKFVESIIGSQVVAVSTCVLLCPPPVSWVWCGGWGGSRQVSLWLTSYFPEGWLNSLPPFFLSQQTTIVPISSITFPTSFSLKLAND